MLKGSWNEQPPQTDQGRKTCPICGYPLQLRYKSAYGLKLYICTNEPEVCSFMTNEYNAGKLAIMKCDRCRDGYLIVKPVGNHDYFLGCTNYKKDGTGCGKVIWKKQYYEMFGLEPDPELQQEKKQEPIQRKEYKVKTPYTKKREEHAASEPKQKPDLGTVLFENVDLNDAVFTTLCCLDHVSEHRFYGVSVLTDVLRGVHSTKIQKAQLDTLPEYGVLYQLQRDVVVAIIEWLIANQFILQTKSNYPVLHPTYNGQHYAEQMTKAKLTKLQRYLREPEEAE